MKQQVRALAEWLLPAAVLNPLRERRRKKQMHDWINAGRPAPPPQYVKQQVVANYQRLSGFQVLVETGTYLGDMVKAQKDNFRKIFSIELSDELYMRAARRFRHHKHVTIMHGDSAKELAGLIAKLNEPAIFWLDGHYSGEFTAGRDNPCPLMDELSAIFQSSQVSVILIDDARMFTGENGYPSMKEVNSYISEHAPWLNVKVEDDIVHCVPSSIA
jgi:hypothetical protein